jgi:putative addiction module killer protein
MERHAKAVVEYLTEDGRNPFRNWLASLKDRRAQAAIEARLTRVRLGNLGHCRSVGGSVMEFKIDFGPGYRVYFGQDGDKIVVLLCGGDKSTQAADIKKAQTYWADYQENLHGS